MSALPIAITALSPAISLNFTGGDQVSQLLTSPTDIFLIGTVESTSSQYISSTPFGGSDGFITALNSHGTKLWDLRLGSSGDDVATAGYVDSFGNIWVVGAIASSPTGATPAPGLNRLAVWEVSSSGSLVNTFTKDLTSVEIPTSIVPKGRDFIIQGISSLVNQPTFTVSLTALGRIGSVNAGSLRTSKNPMIFAAASSAYGWQSFVTNSKIKGVVGIPLHQSTTVLTRSSLKNHSLKSIYSLQGIPLSLQYRSGLGVLLLSHSAGGYFVTIIHTK